MRRTTLALLECPFCGGALQLQPSPAPVLVGQRIASGILQCACCAYPVVEGIAYMRTGARASAAMEHLGGDRSSEALLELLELDGERRVAFEETRVSSPTFRSLLHVLGGADREYLLYRFSDPTFLCSEAVATVLAQNAAARARPVLDFGGGAGHVTRTLSREAPGVDVVLADVSFWELWLARQIVVPNAEVICCDGNAPLPFRKGAFALVFSSDAFHYVWSRRLLASELVRAAANDAVVALTHLHNADAFNWSAGMPLAAQQYRHLFEQRVVRLFAEDDIKRGLVDDQLDLSIKPDDVRLKEAAAFVLLAAPDESPFRCYRLPVRAPANPHINPIYQTQSADRQIVLRMRDGLGSYAEEFSAFREYLPEELALPHGWKERLAAADIEMIELARRRVLLDLPDGYA